MEPTTINLLHILKEKGIVRLKKIAGSKRAEKIFNDFIELREIKTFVNDDEEIIILDPEKTKIDTFLV